MRKWTSPDIYCASWNRGVT